MQPMIKAIIFDFDGTLVDSVDAYMRLFLEMGERFGTRPITKDDFLDLNGRDVKDALIHMIKEGTYKIRVIPHVLWNLRKYKRRVVEETSPYRHVHEALSQLKAKYKIGLVTSNQRKHVQKLCEKYDLCKYFAYVITQDDVRERKPKPHPYLKMAELLGVKPDECLVVEDTPYGVMAANRAGMHTCVVEHTTPQKYFQGEGIPEQFIKDLSILTQDFVLNHYPS